MDFDTGKEIINMPLSEAQGRLFRNDDFNIGSNDPEIAKAVIRIVLAIKHQGFKLIKLQKLLDGINELALNSIFIQDKSKADIYIKCLEDVTALIKTCLEEGVNDDK